MDIEATIKRTFIQPYIEKIYCSKCGNELMGNDDKDAKSIMLLMLCGDNLQFHYRCEYCGIDYVANKKYPDTGYDVLGEQVQNDKGR